MSLIGALPESNKAPGSGSSEKDTGSGVAMTGYTDFPFPSEQPATSNSDVKMTKDLPFSNVNQGTSLSSYHHQNDQVSSESGDSGSKEEGIPE